jgi:hypothetical protein
VACCFRSNVERLKPFYDHGTRAVINYWAAFGFDKATKTWRQQPESSFNSDGKLPPFDLTRPYGGLPREQAWLAPQPGGSVFWSLGYYPAGVPGIGPPGALFVLSTEEWWGGTWYMLNQDTLDRGPQFAHPEQEGAMPGHNENWCRERIERAAPDQLRPAGCFFLGASR